MIDDFVIKEPLIFQFGRAWDYEKILALSDEDFAGFYLELMTEYRDKDEWWSLGKVPSCSQCHAEIPGPKQLRRYYGNTMDDSCFKEFYEKEGSKDKHESKLLNRYWERVAKLVIP